MGFPDHLNGDACFQWLNVLNGTDHTRLVMYEMEKFYGVATGSDNFRSWVALIVWSILRASDQYNLLYLPTTQQKDFDRQKYTFMTAPTKKGYSGLSGQTLADLLKVLFHGRL